MKIRNRSALRGFTLLELLLVVVIMLLSAVVAVPVFIRSFKGAQLRTATRTVVMANKHARSTAVLNQVTAAILYSPERNEIKIVVEQAPANGDADKFLNGGADTVFYNSFIEDFTLEPVPRDESVKLTRALPSDVAIAGIIHDLENAEEDGATRIKFYSNGMCDEYVIRLEDNEGRVVELAVDPLTGDVVVGYEN